MPKFICVLTILGFCLHAPVWAQKPASKTQPSAPATTAGTEKTASTSSTAVNAASPGELKVTPEMWFYQQNLRLYLDPKMAVRANAEFYAEQRQRRLAAMHWFGFSNSRPRASIDPYHGDSSPGWTSNNPAYPYRWAGVGQAWWYVARPERTLTYSY